MMVPVRVVSSSLYFAYCQLSLSDFSLHIFLLFFFFLMIRRPPRSTLFPTRRSSDLKSNSPAMSRATCRAICIAAGETPGRSEEHTSELQSLTNLVCRLLLEKKKKKKNKQKTIKRRRIIIDNKKVNTQDVRLTIINTI